MSNSDQNNHGANRMAWLIGREIVREIGILDRTFIQWFNRLFASWFPKKANQSPECSGAAGNALSVNEQIYVQERLASMDLLSGFRHRANDPLDQLLRPVEKEVKDAKICNAEQTRRNRRKLKR